MNAADASSLRRLRNALATATVAFLIAFIAIGMQLGGLEGAAGKVAQLLAASPQVVIGDWDKREVGGWALAYVLLDFPFIAIYVALVLVIARLRQIALATAAQPWRGTGVTLASVAALTAIAGGAFDLVEDTAMLRLFAEAHDGAESIAVTAHLVHIGTRGKMLTLVGAGLLILLRVAERFAVREK